mmetsp:Transcript_49516/g.97454  ORF Transcript_49516/g.97454 Transcript_49516/m.97454 type:complete len:301 (-) Transcript_49516:200-1102(-)
MKTTLKRITGESPRTIHQYTGVLVDIGHTNKEGASLPLQAKSLRASSPSLTHQDEGTKSCLENKSPRPHPLSNISLFNSRKVSESKYSTVNSSHVREGSRFSTSAGRRRRCRFTSSGGSEASVPSTSGRTMPRVHPSCGSLMTAGMSKRTKPPKSTREAHVRPSLPKRVLPLTNTGEEVIPGIAHSNGSPPSFSTVLHVPHAHTSAEGYLTVVEGTDHHINPAPTETVEDRARKDRPTMVVKNRRALSRREEAAKVRRQQEREVQKHRTIKAIAPPTAFAHLLLNHLLHPHPDAVLLQDS